MFASSSRRFLQMNIANFSQRHVAKTIRFQPGNASARTMRWSNGSNPSFSSNLFRGKNTLDHKTMDKGPKKMQSATLVAPDIIPVLRQNQDSLLETTVSRIKEPLEASVSRTKELAETSVSRTKESAAKEIAEASISRTKELAESVGVRLTPNELTTLRQKLSDTSGQTIQEQMNDLAQDALKRKATREICLSVIASNENALDKKGFQVIQFFDYLGTALFAVVGAQVAGDAGMNLVGCSLVGCAAAMGGGSINALLYGGTTPLLGGSPGVRWVANPSFLLVALAASIVTFFGWPYYCNRQANRYIDDADFDRSDAISREEFLNAWYYRRGFQKTIRAALPDLGESKDKVTSKIRMDELFEHGDGARYFDYIDSDSSGDIDREELLKLAQQRFYNGWETYWLETFGLTSLSMAGVFTAIRLGLHPVVAATSGVTVCFGGIVRDLLVGRDIKVGSQSYAFATGATSATAVMLRELTIRRVLVLPLVVRTFLSAGACVALRGYEFVTGKPILSPMHDDAEISSSYKSPITTTYTIEEETESFGREEGDRIKYVQLAPEGSLVADTLNSPFNYEMSEAARVVL